MKLAMKTNTRPLLGTSTYHKIVGSRVSFPSLERAFQRFKERLSQHDNTRTSANANTNTSVKPSSHQTTHGKPHTQNNSGNNDFSASRRASTRRHQKPPPQGRYKALSGRRNLSVSSDYHNRRRKQDLVILPPSPTARTELGEDKAEAWSVQWEIYRLGSVTE